MDARLRWAGVHKKHNLPAVSERTGIRLPQPTYRQHWTVRPEADQIMTTHTSLQYTSINVYTPVCELYETYNTLLITYYSCW